MNAYMLEFSQLLFPIAEL
uniref:Uncharacterized protein n=1 Tax=Arundo donax TaxID=35708 RepID=A0A0A9B9L4_ARUDO